MIQELGQKADYLDHPHTVAHFRRSTTIPAFSTRQTRGKWVSLGSPTILDQARAQIDKLRRMPTRSILSAAQRRELLAIEKKWTQALT